MVKKDLSTQMFETAIEEGNKVPIEELKGCFPGDPERTDFILNQLTPKEKKDGYPTAEGLRRVTSKILGDIVKSTSHVAVEPCFDNMLTTIVEHTVVINDGTQLKEFTAVGEASPNTLEPPYDKSPAACASTKALGRALRDALQLQTLVAEEKDSSSPNDMINSSQIKAIASLCGKLNLDPVKTINYMNSDKLIYKQVEDLDREVASDVLRHLNFLNNNPDKIEERYKNG